MNQYADSLAFPFLRRELLSDDPARTLPTQLPDLIHATTVPPMITDMQTIAAKHAEFVEDWKTFGLENTTAFFGLQHPPVDATYEDLEMLDADGVVVMTLAYEGENVYGGGFATPDAPLTPRGRQLMFDMATTGIALDLSHAGHRTAKDAVRVCRTDTRAPRVLVSHAGCYEVFAHRRNLPDDVLKGVADSGGVIGLPLITWMLDGSHNGFEPFLRHLSHLMRRVSIDAICIASDSEYENVPLPYTAAQTEAFEAMRAKLDPRGNFNPRFPELPELFARPDRMTQVQRVLEHGGMSETNIEKVLYGNLQRFVTETGIRPI